MTKPPMTAQEEYDFYADPANQEPQGPARRRRANLSELVPVRFDKDTIDKVKELAAADDRSVSSWIRRAVEHELDDSDRRSA